MIRIHKGDITRLEVDGIVNAANSQLIAGGGVDRAIHKAAGPGLKIELEKTASYLPTGDAIVTSGCNLPAKRVIHTVSPKWNGGGNGELAQLALCYENAMNLALSQNLSSIAFPSLGTGAFGIPIHVAAQIAIQTIASFDVESLGIEVIFCVFSDADCEIYTEVLEKTKSSPWRPMEGVEDCPVCFWPAYSSKNNASEKSKWKCTNCGWDSFEVPSLERETDWIQFLCLDSLRRLMFGFKYHFGLPVPRGPIVGPGDSLFSLDSPMLHGYFNPSNHTRLGEMWIAFSTELVESAMPKIQSENVALKPAALEFLGFRQVHRKPIFRAWI